MRRWGILVAVGLVGALAVFPIPAGAAEHAVRVVNNAYDPVTVTIAPGDTVVWTQAGSNPHSVTADDASFDSHPACPPVCMSQGNTFRHTFGAAGTFRYHCRIHGRAGGQGMSGTVVVQAATTTTAPPVNTTAAPTTTARPTTTTAARATTTTAVTTTTVAPTTSSSSSTSSSSTSLEVTSSTAIASGGDDDGDDGGGGVPAVLILLAILAVAGGGGFALWRLRPRPPSPLP